ncbi:MAG: T9SS type A sorting domain-containing protein [Ferruginibacter sp.]
MIKNIIATIALLLIVFPAVYSQAPAIEWQKCFGGIGPQGCYDAQVTTDGIIACGTIQSAANGDISTDTHGGGDFWIVNLDPSGTIIWDKTLGGTNDEIPHKIQQTSDGGYIVVGSTRSNNTGDVGSNHGGLDYWVVKLNNLGAIVWAKTFGGSNDDIAYGVQQTNDGGYIVCGESYSTDGDITAAHGDRDYWVLKLDSFGNLVWQKSLGGSGVDFFANSIKQTTDGGYIVTGGTSSTDGDVSNPNAVFGIAWIVKLNAGGSIEWQKTYGSLSTGEYGSGICQTNDGGYAATGTCYGNSGDVTGNHGLTDFWVIKLDALGNLIWQKSFGGTMLDEPKCIIQCSDGNLLVTGLTFSTNGDITGNNGNADYWVIKVSMTGSLIWQKTLGGSSGEFAMSISESADHGYVIGGSANSSNSGDVGTNHESGFGDYWIVKLVADVVPVKLTRFDAVAKGNDVICDWQTQMEQNSSYFIVERSKDAIFFNEAGSVRAGGNSSLPLNYSFTDKNILLADNNYLYYRLKMVDIDGTIEYSNIVAVKLKHSAALSVYPDPVVDKMALNFISDRNDKADLTIFNATGVKVYEHSIAIIKGSNTANVNVHSFPAGGYLIVLKGRNQYFARFIKNK